MQDNLPAQVFYLEHICKFPFAVLIFTGSGIRDETSLRDTVLPTRGLLLLLQYQTDCELLLQDVMAYRTVTVYVDRVTYTCLMNGKQVVKVSMM